ncbi:hypothetical protein [Billgrantia montanilacus]|uniref:Uncharacterized protein n=1 Tax=Billgrantia montanilacus TaxID=2282305 RepID=A0A368U3V1_9GAMM|nr:hypothetical protein [Halomonas montanilacus]RCV89703.1 hypothetical protein DU505_08860 [Halomonas montanilacus]
MSTMETIRNPGTTYSRSPNGCSKQVMTQITPQERKQLEAIAQTEMRSLSATLRMLMLRGIQGYEDDTLAAS